MKMNEVEAEYQKMLKDESIEVYAPTLSLADYFDNDITAILTVGVVDWPKPVSFEDADGNPQASMVMTVKFKGSNHSLWLSSESLKRGVIYQFQQEGAALLGREITITRRDYIHKKFGKTYAYNVTLEQTEQETLY